MLHRLLTIVACLLLCTAARAHFIFIVPQPGNDKAKVIMSEDLEPDPEVSIDIIAGARLSLMPAGGKPEPVKLEQKTDGAFLIDLPGKGTRIVFGSAMLGVRQKGDAKAYLLAYYPKTIVGDPFDPAATLGDKAAVELIPVNDKGKLRLKFVAGGKPYAGAEITVMMPDGSVKKPVTDKDGLTDAYDAKGRFGAWTKAVENKSGELDGKKYQESRSYAMLVIDTSAALPAAAASSSPTGTRQPQRIPGHGTGMSGMPPMPEKLDAVKYPTQLPVATSSFGAVAVDGYLYYYGGHIARTHSYSVEAVTGQFARLKLADASAQWETLPGGPGLQGMNLAAHGGKVYRVGGMQPRNYPGTKAELYSVPDVARFDPGTKQWESLPSLPEPRSSHDVVVVGDKLIVVGGWNMNARDGNTWVNTTLVMDLGDSRPAWKPVQQPFERRALIAAVFEGKVYIAGGLDAESEVHRTVDIFDPATGAWSTGPELPGKPLNGFSPAACVLGGKLYVSVADGTMYVLNDQKSGWDKVGVATPRIVHRLIPVGSQVLIVGGAMRGVNLDLIETLATDGKTAGGAQDPADQAKPAAARSAAAEPVGPVLTPTVANLVCPIMPNVEVGSEPDLVEFNGIQIGLCCSTCVRKFKADPAAYLLPEYLPQLAGQTVPTRSIKQVYCPVYKDRVVSEKDPSVTYQGKTIYLFNRQAVTKWEANPGQYADPKLLPQLAD